MIYVIMFIISLFCFRIANKYNDDKRIFYIFSFIAIMAPCLLAAARSLEIGTDVKIYIEPYFTAASWFESFFSYVKYITSCNDILYLFVTFICRKLSSNISLLFFVLELLIILPVYATLIKNRKNSNTVVLGMFIFYMFFYNVTFNMARQSVALAFAILSLTCLEKKEYKRTILYFLISSLFHSSAFVMLFIYLFFFWINTKQFNDKQKKLVFNVFIILTILIMFNLKNIISFLISIGILSDKYLVYVTKYLRSSFDFSITNTLFYTYIYLLIIKNKKLLITRGLNYQFYKLLSLYSIVVLQLGGIIAYANRLSFYFVYPVIFNVLPILAPDNLNKMSKKSFYSVIAIISGFIIYWVFWIIILRFHETFPYKFIGG